MKLHVQCDRCGKHSEAVPRDFGWRAPNDWFHLRACAAPRDQGWPADTFTALLCGDCMPIVQKAVEAAIARKT